MTTTNHFPYALGLDLGSNSIGWAIIRLDEEDNPCQLVNCGVRAFEAGMEGEYELGKEESRNTKRRMARLARRQTERRARRLRKMANLLQRIGLLPQGNLSDSAERQRIFQELDENLKQIYITPDTPPDKKHQLHQVFIYHLRALSLDQRLEPFALGRVFYHLCQRRGFLSTRRGQKMDEKEKGEVSKGISEIRAEMQQLGAETLGRYFAQIDPTDAGTKRIRGRWTARDMYEHEFYSIWDNQAKYYPEILTDENKEKVFKAIFKQRPLKSQKHTIGVCIFENIARGAKRNRRRAPWCLLKAQRFRLLQRVNDLEIREGRFQSRPLTSQERSIVIDHLEKEGDTTFSELRKLLGLPKTTKFNLEEGGEKKIPGNRTASQIRTIIGTLWDNMTPSDRDKLVEDLYSIINTNALKKRLINHWKFNETQAEALANMPLEDGYCNLSRQAIDRFLPGLEQGRRYGELVKELYGMDEFAFDFTVQLLPPLNEAPIGEIRNPTVFRTLAEMRKIVNAIIKKYGKPKYIRIESGKDLRRTKKERQAIWEANRELETQREKIKKILIEQGLQNPTNADIERFMLAEECQWTCPYTGKAISFSALFGPEPQFDIEHIIPFSRCLDNSFKNKTLCYLEENRQRKHNFTPYEAYGSDPERWQEIIQRVERFNSRESKEKLRRFLLKDEELEEFINNFTSSQLNDTRYASRTAVKYCALLYGKEFRKHVFTVSGAVTSTIRWMWDLNKILGSTEKNRDDLRQHAIDAIVIALTSPKMVKNIAEQAKQIPAYVPKRERFWRHITPPWETLYNEAHEKVLNIIVSHRPERKVSGRLHEETYYSPPKPGDKPGETVVHVRKPLYNLSAGEIEDIVDPVVRKTVKEKLEQLGGGDPKKVFANPDNYPLMPNKKGLIIPIKSVRIKKRIPVFPIGKNERLRYVTSDENHHMEIFEIRDKKGRIKWDANVISMFEAMQRKREGKDIIRRQFIRDDGTIDENAKFLFSLCKKDMVKMIDAQGKEEIFVVTGISNEGNRLKRISYKPHYFAKRPESTEGLRKVPNKLKESMTKKLYVTVLGEVYEAHD